MVTLFKIDRTILYKTILDEEEPLKSIVLLLHKATTLSNTIKISLSVSLDKKKNFFVLLQYIYVNCHNFYEHLLAKERYVN